MKKLLLIMLPLLAALLLGSCRGDDGPMGPEGPMGPAGLDGVDGEGFKTLEYEFLVAQNDWKAVTNTDEPYFMYDFDFTKLDSYVIDHGMITVYRVFDNGNFTALPNVKLRKETNQAGKEITYTQLIDYEFAPSFLCFYVTNSDFYMDEKPDAMKFKVVVHYY